MKDFDEIADKMVRLEKESCEKNARLTASVLRAKAPRGKTGNLKKGFDVKCINGTWYVMGAPHFYLVDQETRERSTRKKAHSTGKARARKFIEPTINRLKPQYDKNRHKITT